MGQTHGKPAAPEHLEPTWDIARLFPKQGTWSEEEYLALNTNHLVEFSHGHVEVLPTPTMTHQLIMLLLYRLLQAFVERHELGVVLVAPLRVQLWPGKYREPDIVFMRAEHADRLGEQFWQGADLVMEVVSDDRQRDLQIKRQEYAEAGIPEYWIIDPQLGQITVLWLEPPDQAYREHSIFPRGTRARSRLLPGFEVDVDAALAGRL